MSNINYSSIFKDAFKTFEYEWTLFIDCTITSLTNYITKNCIHVIKICNGDKLAKYANEGKITSIV